MITNEAEARAWVRRLPECDETARDRLEEFIFMLGEENGRQNLVASSSLAEVWQRHIVDSAQLLPYVPRETPDWLDLGTGAGFPGIVVSILRPECNIVLVESRKRRIEWLERVISKLGLNRATVQGSRVETMPQRHFPVISARAFAPLDRLLELSARFSTADTIWLLPKGQSTQQELDKLRGWTHMFHVEPSVTDPRAGVIVGTLQGRKGKPS